MTFCMFAQPRYLLTSLALNDLTIGLFITPFGLLPALFHCWPYGEIFCQIQALLRGALSQQSAVILVCMAIDRYMHALHPRKYYQLASKKSCVAILSCTWVLSLVIFSLLVLPKDYFFNNTGLLACEPFYSKPSYRILATCAFYFPTTMVLMYCYGSSFHTSHFHSIEATTSTKCTAAGSGMLTKNGIQSCPSYNVNTILNSSSLLSAPIHDIPISDVNMTMNTGLGMTINMMLPIQQQRDAANSTSRSMAAISLGFIVLVTPWTIQEIVTACTGSRLPPFLDFLVTWMALSNSFWNPFIYWLLNLHFRRLGRNLLPASCMSSDAEPAEHTPDCCRANVYCDSIGRLPCPRNPPISRQFCHNDDKDSDSNGTNLRRSESLPKHMAGNLIDAENFHVPARPDIEIMSEKYWGEILERTMSSNSLHAMERNFNGQRYCHNSNATVVIASPPPPPPRACRAAAFLTDRSVSLSEQEEYLLKKHRSAAVGIN